VTELEVIRWRSVRAWDWLEETVADVTTEQANWWPPGTANSIGATYFHIVGNADVELHRLLLDRPPRVEADWHGAIGHPYDPEHFDRWIRDQDVEWPLLRRYGQAVHAAVVALLDGLTAADLDRPVDMQRVGLGMWEGRELLHLHGIEHVRIHGGEIACLKGLQGGTGWAESDLFRSVGAPLTPDGG
jgi:hypothetical protein